MEGKQANNYHICLSRYSGFDLFVMYIYESNTIGSLEET